MPTQGTGPAGLTSISAPATVAPGGAATVTAQATPGATCSLAPGPLGTGAAPGALGPRVADGAGRVSWSWTVGQIAPGSYVVTVTCGGSSRTATVTVRP